MNRVASFPWQRLTQSQPNISVSQELCSLAFKCAHTPGSLQKSIAQINDCGLNLRRIESRPSRNDPNQYEINVDVEASPKDPRVLKLINSSFVLKDAIRVPWFPKNIADLDHFASNTLDAGNELESSHPGFKDVEYRKRRADIVNKAKEYKHGIQIPKIKYSVAETETWSKVYTKLRELGEKYACKEYNSILPLMEANCGYAKDNIPQLQDISDYLRKVTGFRLRPVCGLLSSRDFLNALAFRTFFSTQYIRHHSSPFYTPEPDICHELLGHVPMFLDPNFADFSQQIGLSSLGASDGDIKRLATCYWFSVEFGLLKEQGNVKAYGAGLLSSFGELEYACSGKKDKAGHPIYLPWDPFVAATQEYPITTYQPTYFLAESLENAKDKMKSFCDAEISKPFNVAFDPYSYSVFVDRNVAPALRSGKC